MHKHRTTQQTKPTAAHPSTPPLSSSLSAWLSCRKSASPFESTLGGVSGASSCVHHLPCAGVREAEETRRPSLVGKQHSNQIPISLRSVQAECPGDIQCPALHSTRPCLIKRCIHLGQISKPTRPMSHL